MTAPLVGATIVAKQELAMARVIARSFLEHHPGSSFHVLLTDAVDGCFDPSQEAFRLLTLEQLGKPGLLPWCFRYARLPLAYALTPVLLRHLLANFDRVVFIKQESLVLAPLQSMQRALEHASIVLTPHLLESLSGDQRLARERAILQAGIYNGGIIGLRADDHSRSFVDWWRARVELNCRHDVASGLHYEQRWLDFVPRMFGRVHVLRDPGCNVGHWHLPERSVRIDGAQVLANGVPCSLFRFSGFDGAAPNRATRYFDRLSLDQLGDAARVFEDYRDRLQDAGNGQCAQWTYSWDRFADGTGISARLRDLYLALGNDVTRFGDPFADHGEGFRAWLLQPQRDECPALPRLWHHLYQLRDDVRAAYPDPFGKDLDGVLGWARNSGWREFGIDPALLPAARA